MKRTYDDGLRFSFGFDRDELVSARSTPKFPSIEISKERQQPSFKHHIKSSTEQIEIQPSAGDMYRQLGGGGVELLPFKKIKNKQVKETVGPLLFAEFSNDNLSCKSIKSLESGILRFPGRKLRHRSNGRQKKVQGSQWLKSLIGTTRNRSGHSLEQKSSNNKVFTFNSLKKGSRSEDKHQNETLGQPSHNSELKQTKRIINSFFEVSPRNVEFRQTKKGLKMIEKSAQIISEKGKSFKNIFQKVRPTLRISGRQISNSKLQQMTRMYESERKEQQQ